MKAVIYEQYGKPPDVLRVAECEPERPGPGMIRVAKIIAPINPADLNTIEGSYPIRPSRFPAIPGVEGVGIVAESQAEGFTPGMAVILPHRYGTWREEGILPAAGLQVVPEDLPLREVAMLKINPATAWRMLHDFVPPEPGGWIIQNAANSAVGRHVIAMARELGLHTINLVRRPEVADELRAAGADLVITEGESDRITAKTGGVPIRLALNAVGGESATRMASLLAPGGTVVTYGAMSRQAIKLPAGLLIFRDLRFRGFWISQWYETAPAPEREAMFSRLFGLVRRGIIRTPVERVYPVAEALKAVARAMEGGRNGKILLGDSA